MGRENMALKGPKSGRGDLGPDWPGWVPVATRTYLAHVEGGQTIRALAKAENVNPSTILRRVRRIENSRDDPLIDLALRRITSGERPPPPVAPRDPEAQLAEQAVPVLRRLAEPDAVLAVARDLDKAVVMRSGPEGEPQRLSTLERAFAVEMALRGWIACTTPEARVQRYRITKAGRMLVRSADGSAPAGFAEEAAAFSGFVDRDAGGRPAQAETTLSILSRRRDGSGHPFLSRDLIAAGERLQEDLALAAAEGATADDWENALAALGSDAARVTAPSGTARSRVEEALIDLGPGLADVTLRTCHLNEGLEQVERRLGWSARSGKVVLRIALERLHQHYRAVEACTGLVRR